MKRLNEEVLEKVVGGRIDPINPYSISAAKKKGLIENLAKGGVGVRTSQWKTSPDKAIPSDFRGEAVGFIPSDAFD